MDRRIVHVVTGDGFAGTEKYVCQVAAASAARGHDVTVVGGEGPRMTGELGSAVAWHEGATVPSTVRTLLRLGRFDVVHAHMTAAELAASAALWSTRGTFVCTRHFAAPRGSSAVVRAVSPLVDGLLDLQIAISEFVATRLGPPPDVVLPHGVQDRASSTGRDKHVLLLQRLESEKDTLTALQGWSASGLTEQGWRLRIAGDGSERAALQDFADRLDVSGSVDFLGFLSDPLPEIDSASLFVASAPAEPFGLSVVEAMSSALPVIATAAGGHLETVGRVADARLFAPGDSGALGEHLRALAADTAGRWA